jgi:hypothetical protein
MKECGNTVLILHTHAYLKILSLHLSGSLLVADGISFVPIYFTRYLVFKVQFS